MQIDVRSDIGDIPMDIDVRSDVSLEDGEFMEID